LKINFYPLVSFLILQKQLPPRKLRMQFFTFCMLIMHYRFFYVNGFEKIFDRNLSIFNDFSKIYL